MAAVWDIGMFTLKIIVNIRLLKGQVDIFHTLIYFLAKKNETILIYVH